MRDDFEKFDKNGDGFLDKDEIKAMLEQNQLNELVGFDEEFYYCMDMNEDGKISFEGIFSYLLKMLLTEVKLFQNGQMNLWPKSSVWKIKKIQIE